MNPKETAKRLLMSPLSDIQTELKKFTPKDAALIIREMLEFTWEPEDCLLAISWNSGQSNSLDIAIRRLFENFDYELETAILTEMDEIDGELHAHIQSRLPELFHLYFLNYPARRELFNKLSNKDLVVLRNLFVYKPNKSKDQNEVENFEKQFEDFLDKTRLNEISRSISIHDKPVPLTDATTTVSEFRRIIRQIESTEVHAYGRTGGHPDPSVGVYGYKVVIQPNSEKGFVATLPDVPEVTANGKDMKHALKEVGDKVATHFEALLNAKAPIPNSTTAFAEVGIAIKDEEAWNYWHPTVEHADNYS